MGGSSSKPRGWVLWSTIHDAATNDVAANAGASAGAGAGAGTARDVAVDGVPLVGATAGNNELIVVSSDMLKATEQALSSELNELPCAAAWVRSLQSQPRPLPPKPAHEQAARLFVLVSGYVGADQARREQHERAFATALDAELTRPQSSSRGPVSVNSYRVERRVYCGDSDLSLLEAAAKEARPTCIGVLVRHGAKLTCQSMQYAARDAYSWEMRAQQVQCLRLLLRLGAPVACRRCGTTALLGLVRLATHEHDGVALLSELLQRGGATTYDPKANDGWTLLHEAAKGSTYSDETTAVLLRAGLDPTAATTAYCNSYPSGTTPLHVVANNSIHAGAASALRSRGANPMARDDNGKTPFDLAPEASNTHDYARAMRRALAGAGSAPAVASASRGAGSASSSGSRRRHTGQYKTVTKTVRYTAWKGALRETKTARVTSGRWTCCGNTRANSTHCGDSDDGCGGTCTPTDNPLCCCIVCFFVVVFSIIIISVLASSGGN